MVNEEFPGFFVAKTYSKWADIMTRTTASSLLFVGDLGGCQAIPTYYGRVRTNVVNRNCKGTNSRAKERLITRAAFYLAKYKLFSGGPSCHHDIIFTLSTSEPVI
jgi:hypothetical protein